MIKFLVFSDLHYDEVADGDKRIEDILTSARKRELDFIVPIEEIQWLQEELSDDMQCIIFPHHSFINDFSKRGVNNRKDIRKMFVGKLVLLCMNGHDHGDSYSFVDGISYLTVNSANYAWLGSQIAS